MFAQQYWFDAANQNNIGTGTGTAGIIFFDGNKFKTKIGTTIDDLVNDFDPSNIKTDLLPHARSLTNKPLNLGGTPGGGAGSKHWSKLYVDQIWNENTQSAIIIKGSLLPALSTDSPPKTRQWNLGQKTNYEWNEGIVHVIYTDDLKPLSLGTLLRWTPDRANSNVLPSGQSQRNTHM